MLQKLWAKNASLAFLAGLANVLAFPNVGISPLLFLTPFFLTLLSLRETRPKYAMRWGFLTSLVIMGGGFYWVIYVIHVFGHLPWAVATLLYLLFCGFGALNFPLFAGAATYLARKLSVDKMPKLRAALWMTLGLPALFSAIEYAIPKLFPWYVGHGLYRWTYVTQIVEWTGCSYLTFAVFSVGSSAAWVFHCRAKNKAPHPATFAIPACLFALALGLSVLRLNQPFEAGREIPVALVQANIGSLEKMEARMGIVARVKSVIERYKALTDKAVASSPKPELILWPETAMPFSLQMPSPFAREVLDAVRAWNVPLITGAYAESLIDPTRDYNAAYLLEPDPAPNARLRMDIYRKNILLAFGEYFPGAEFYPKLYEYFPYVSNFERGREQNIFTLLDGTRVGVTVCYEAIKPEFFRKVGRQNVNLIVNLTNDSWFGPTAEPHQHAALATFRAIETRAPILRVTNTGTSFTVDRFGRMGEQSGVYEEGLVLSKVVLPAHPYLTAYMRFGEWFIVVCVGIVGSFFLRRKNASLPN